MAMAFLLMMVLYCTINTLQAGSSSLRHDHQLLGRPLYKLDTSWPKDPKRFTGKVYGVAVNQNAGLVYVAQRGENVPKVLVFNTDGDFLMAWNTTTLEMPHGIFLADADSNSTVWITDMGNGPYGHCIKQYSPSGELLQTVGTPGKPGSGLSPVQFDHPAEIFVNSSGEMYIVDGDGGMNNRLIKLSKHKEVLWKHEKKGQGIAQFNIPHSVTVDSFQRVWVADRANKRIQVFNSITGEWLGECFTRDDPFSVRFTPDQQYLVVVQLNTNRILLLDTPPVGMKSQCQVASVIQLADDIQPHLVDLDLKTGALYVAEIAAQQAQKFIPLSLGENFV